MDEEEVRYIDANALLKTLKEDYDIEASMAYRIVLKEIENAPTIARTFPEWIRLHLRVQGRKLDKKYAGLPLTRKRHEAVVCWIAGIFLAYLVLSVLGFMELIYFWGH